MSSGFPRVVENWVDLPQGLVLVTGPTGSGKSTTIASILDQVNERHACHIITIEDPIEYVHRHKKAAVNQREIGIDCDSFDRALRSALREDPDVMLVGEMRDPETIQTALTIAETGHLVFATLHTNDAGQALDRIIDVFPGEKQPQIRVQLASSLTGIISQRLVPRIGGGRVAAFEVLVATYAVRNLIREGKGSQLRNMIATGGKYGMQTLEQGLSDLVDERCRRLPGGGRAQPLPGRRHPRRPPRAGRVEADRALRVSHPRARRPRIPEAANVPDRRHQSAGAGDASRQREDDERPAACREFTKRRAGASG